MQQADVMANLSETDRATGKNAKPQSGKSTPTMRSYTRPTSGQGHGNSLVTPRKDEDYQELASCQQQRKHTQAWV